ncbi:hypothetical protein JMN32_19640 [Fulvivirga sp. 29W222]|uniref:Lipoprotein n=1 Tax=Fulvivirga marina TaxID=2494733 RepID=A0A937KFU6_9BACT|nr:hypothetical protein [Fulvivirga marina]MBL6448533.1 hypothetical protein [Fulvivirga marina]
MKRSIIIILAALAGACAGTKITKYTGSPRLLANTKILFLSTLWLNDYRSQELFGLAQKKLDDNSQLYYLPGEEYNLIKAGVGRDPIAKVSIRDTASLAVIAEKLGVRYVIGTEVIGLREGGSYGTYTENELDPSNSMYNADNESNSASLMFFIYDLNSRSVNSKFQVKTTIGAMRFQDDEGGESSVNVTDQITALTVAYEKGIKLIRKEMVSITT